MTTPQIGDLLRSPRGLYNHYGVFIAPDSVFELSGDARKELSSARCRVSSFEKFADGNPVFIVKRSSAPDGVFERLMQVLNRQGYSLANGNCEHAARYVADGEWRSTQVTLAVTVGIAVGVYLLARQ